MMMDADDDDVSVQRWHEQLKSFWKTHVFKLVHTMIADNLTT